MGRERTIVCIFRRDSLDLSQMWIFDLEFVWKGIMGRARDGGMGDELTGGTYICSYRHGFDSLVAFCLHLTRTSANSLRTLHVSISIPSHPKPKEAENRSATPMAIDARDIYLCTSNPSTKKER